MKKYFFMTILYVFSLGMMSAHRIPNPSKKWTKRIAIGTAMIASHGLRSAQIQASPYSNSNKMSVVPTVSTEVPRPKILERHHLLDSAAKGNSLQLRHNFAPQTVPISQEDTRYYFSKVTRGTPIAFPLVFSSDPSISLMLVSNDSINLSIDRAYIVDSTQDHFDFFRDVYQLDSVKCVIDSDGGFSSIIAVVSHNEIKREFEVIDSLIYPEILQINRDRMKIKSNLTIPIRIVEGEEPAPKPRKLHPAER